MILPSSFLVHTQKKLNKTRSILMFMLALGWTYEETVGISIVMKKSISGFSNSYLYITRPEHVDAQDDCEITINSLSRIEALDESYIRDRL